MPRAGAVILSDLVGKLELIRVECKKCDRKGRYRVLRLMKELGPDFSLVAFKERVTADCPKRTSQNLYDQCGASFPDLAGLMPAPEVRPERPRRK